MTDEEMLQKMEEDMKLRNFSKYSFYTYSHKAAEMVRYFNKTMEEVTTNEEILNDVKRGKTLSKQNSELLQ